MTANLRIIWDNAGDRATSLAASSVAGALVAANLQSDFKGLVCRSSGTSQVFTYTWTAGETIGGIALPMHNMTVSATIRVQLYSDTGCTVQVADSGTVNACPGMLVDTWNWTTINANTFPYGGFRKSAVWFTPVAAVKGCKITLSDSTNPAGYIDVARAVVGTFWESSRNPDYGLKVASKDTTKTVRNEASDLMADLGVTYETLDLNLKLLSATDRTNLLRIVRAAGTRKNILVSVFPDQGNSVLEQDYTIFGKRADADMSADFYNQYSQAMQLQSW